MDSDAGAVVSAAAMQTMRGGAHVTLSCGMSVPEFEGNGQYVGLVDFDGDRCRLDAKADAAAQAIAFEGPVSYTRQADGRWTWTKGAPGTHNMFDPRWALEALAHAQKSAVATAAHVVELALEYEKLNAGTDIGLSRDWDESTAVVQLSPSGRIGRATVTHRSHDHPDAWMRFDYQITEAADLGPVELPKPKRPSPLSSISSGRTVSPTPRSGDDRRFTTMGCRGVVPSARYRPGACLASASLSARQRRRRKGKLAQWDGRTRPPE